MPLKDPNAVAAIVSTLRQVHGDNFARTLLADGVGLAALIAAALSSPTSNRVAIRTIARALESRDFIISPDIGPLWHIKYVYDGPGSLTVVDMVVLTPERTFTSVELTLRLAPLGD